MSIIYSQTANVKEMCDHFCLQGMDHFSALKRQLFIKPFDKASFITIGQDHKRIYETGYWGLLSSDGIPITDLNCHDIPRWHSSMEPPKRCLIPATSFAVGLPPNWFCFEDDISFSLFAMAGIRFRKKNKWYFLMLTRSSDQTVLPISQRMPLILKPDELCMLASCPLGFCSKPN